MKEVGVISEVEKEICELFSAAGLGKPDLPVLPVSGGFLHRMYRVCAEGKIYAVKHLNPEIMKRPDAADNYERAETLEKVLEEAGIPVSAALSIGGHKMQTLFGNHYYIFSWLEGSITDWNDITPEQCAKAGELLGRIHAIEQRQSQDPHEISRIDWDLLIKDAKKSGSKIAPLLEENRDLLFQVQEELNRARTLLPKTLCITDEDMDPKNVMWHDGKPTVIDLECLDYGNPASCALQLSLQWAGVTTCDADPEKLRSFFKGYLSAYDDGFRGYDGVFGLAYTWTEWLEYNISRALGACADEAERALGEEEVKNTLARIRYLKENEESLKEVLRAL